MRANEYLPILKAVDSEVTAENAPSHVFLGVTVTREG